MLSCPINLGLLMTNCVVSFKRKLKIYNYNSNLRLWLLTLRLPYQTSNIILIFQHLHIKDAIINLPGNYEKIQHTGLQIQYRDKMEQLKSFICRTAALAFVPIRFANLCMGRNKSRYSKVTKNQWMFMYFETTWIAGTFHSADWNLYKTWRTKDK